MMGQKICFCALMWLIIPKLSLLLLLIWSSVNIYIYMDIYLQQTSCISIANACATCTPARVSSLHVYYTVMTVNGHAQSILSEHCQDSVLRNGGLSLCHGYRVQ